jgi:hypothetical protein
MWVVSPGDPVAKAALLAEAASANKADPAPNRPLRSSSVIILLLQFISLAVPTRDAIERCKNRAMQADFRAWRRAENADRSPGEPIARHSSGVPTPRQPVQASCYPYRQNHQGSKTRLKAIGLRLSDSFLLRADEVIE